jgi:YggT family protein
MVALLWLVRIYRIVLVAWVVLTWIPGVGGSSLHQLLGYLVVPVIAPFSFLSLGPISIAPLIPLVILYFLENWLARQVGEVDDTGDQPAAEPHSDPSVFRPEAPDGPRRWDNPG